jgi:acyl carrier protein
LTNEHAILERLGAVFAESFHMEAPASDTDLLESGILDSFQFVELLFQLEQNFGFRVNVEEIELEDLRTLARIARLVATNGGAGDSSATRPSAGVHG